MLPLLADVALLAGVGVLAVLLMSRLRLPVIAGLILAGVVAGPHGFGLVRDAHLVETFAQVGVVLLLFTIGLEFSMARLARIRRLVAIGGTLQVGLTTGLAALLAMLAGEPVSHALVIGFIVALSSTALVMRALVERDEVDSPHGKFIIGALIFQDLCVVPMMLLLPLLAGRGDGSLLAPLALALLKTGLVAVAVYAASRYLIGRLLATVDRARSRELFLLTVVALLASVSYITELAGLSPALGAFLAGVMLADSDQAHRAMSDVLPLRDLFSSMFFLSVGMLFDAQVLLDRPVAVVGLSAGVLLGKALIATIACLAMRFPPAVAVVAGAGLSSLGEFGFVLAQQGGNLGLLSSDERAMTFAVSVMTMFVAPLAVRLGPHLAAGASRLHRLERLLGTRGIEELSARGAKLEGHVVVVGYGVAGRLLCGALNASGIAHVVLEISAETVRRARRARVAAYHADASSEESLAHAQLQHAKALVLLINDRHAAERAIAAARRFAPEVPVLVRTRYLSSAKQLKQLGATDVVSEEVEAGVEMLARVLREFALPRNLLAERLREAREETLESARPAVVPRRRLGAMAELDDLKVESFLVREGSHAAGKSAVSLQLRTRTGAMVVAGRRDGKVMENPQPHLPFLPGDIVYMVGDGPRLSAAMELLESGVVSTTHDEAAVKT